MVDGELEQRLQRKQPGSPRHRRRGVGLAACRGHPRHQDGPVLVRDDQVDDPRLLAGVRVHQRAEHRDLVAMRRAHPVAADPAWPGEQLGEVACVVGLRHPGDEVGQRLADDVGVRPAEQLLGLSAPVLDGAALVGLHHGDADRRAALAEVDEVRGSRRLRRLGLGRRQSELEPDPLRRLGVLDPPGLRDLRHEIEAAPGGLVSGGRRDRGGQTTRGVAVADADLHISGTEGAADTDLGARVHHRVGHELVGEQHGVVDHGQCTPVGQRLPDEAPGGRRRGGLGSELMGRLLTHSHSLHHLPPTP